jgi:hypothetical protein
LSGAFASGVFVSFSGACAATRAGCPKHKKIAAAQKIKLFFIRLRPLAKCDCVETDERAGLYVGAPPESKEVEAQEK